MDLKKCSAAFFSAPLVVSSGKVIMPGTAYSADIKVDAEVEYTEESGKVTIYDGSEWYKVNSFEDGKEYIIGISLSDGTERFVTAEGRESPYIFNFYKQTMVTSTAAPYTALKRSGKRLVFSGGEALMVGNTGSNETWEYNDGLLMYTSGGKTSYAAYSGGFTYTDNKSEAAVTEIFTRGDTLGRCILTQPAAESYVIAGSGYSAPVFRIELTESDIVADSVTWFVDGEEKMSGGLSFKADELTGKPAGVHRVSCLIEAHDSKNNHYRERSEEALFIIAEGIVPNSVFTFSDVHGEYHLIADAIETIMAHTGNNIPSLIISTGDWANGPRSDYETALNWDHPRMKASLGGIDTVYVAGNHDSSEAAAEISKAAGLGADDDIDDGCGVIFNGSKLSGTYSENADISAKDIIVYGINYKAAEFQKDESICFSYKNVIPQIEDFLKETAKDYHGQLVIISAHSGLHVLGEQSESIDKYGRNIGSWIGENAYNPDDSAILAAVLNHYAREYGMDIMYLFGHDHSRSEKEFILTAGDELTSTISYDERKSVTIPLDFTYAHSGYLSTQIGCADAIFSFIYRDGDKYSYDLMKAGESEILRHTDIASRYVPKETTEIAASTSITTTNEVTSSAASSATSRSSVSALPSATTFSKENNPFTADTFTVLPTAAAAAAILFIMRRRK